MRSRFPSFAPPVPAVFLFAYAVFALLGRRMDSVQVGVKWFYKTVSNLIPLEGGWVGGVCSKSALWTRCGERTAAVFTMKKSRGTGL
jgi:hypothetical protein